MARVWEVVIASADLENRRRVLGMLTHQGVDCLCASTVSQCQEILNGRKIGLLFSDRNLSDGSYQDILRLTGGSGNLSTKVVVMSALMTPFEYEQARRCGVFDVISVPCRPTDIEWMVILAKRAELIRPQPRGITAMGAKGRAAS